MRGHLTTASQPRNFMMTEALRISRAKFWVRVLELWERVLRLSRRSPRRLRLCESLPLGDRRFVAVVEFEQARFLVGGTPSALVLLSRLTDGASANGEQEFASPDMANVTGTIRGETC